MPITVYLVGKNCLAETVHIESQATHKSTDYAMYNANGDGYEPVDADIKWIWTGR